MPRPKRPDCRNHLPPFVRRFRHDPVQHARAEVSSIQNDVDDEHETDDGVPSRDHAIASLCGVMTACWSGPLAISRPVSPRKSGQRTKYRPKNQITVNVASAV